MGFSLRMEAVCNPSIVPSCCVGLWWQIAQSESNFESLNHWMIPWLGDGDKRMISAALPLSWWIWRLPHFFWYKKYVLKMVLLMFLLRQWQEDLVQIVFPKRFTEFRISFLNSCFSTKLLTGFSSGDGDKQKSFCSSPFIAGDGDKLEWSCSSPHSFSIFWCNCWAKLI